MYWRAVEKPVIGGTLQVAALPLEKLEQGHLWEQAPPKRNTPLACGTGGAGRYSIVTASRLIRRA
ncbi:hypothetical protein ACP3W1_27035, partial [Salmonella enterica]|uniref:hypothetical protein n=1 Tax=Salmonella enterica TaxID=28901 RepID=UPI003CF69A43